MQRRKFMEKSMVGWATLSLPTPKTRSNPKSFTVKNGEARFGIHTPFKGINTNDVKISGKDTDGQLAVFEYIGHEKIGPSYHIHLDQDEIFMVIEGEYRFKVGEKEELLKAGDTIFLPRQIPHTWIQLTDYGKLTYMVQPAGQLEEFFLKMNELKQPPTEEEAQKISMAHGMKNIGPPLTLD